MNRCLGYFVTAAPEELVGTRLPSLAAVARITACGCGASPAEDSEFLAALEAGSQGAGRAGVWSGGFLACTWLPSGRVLTWSGRGVGARSLTSP